MSLIASDKYVVVVGLGMTGLSVLRFLKKMNRDFRVMDTRTDPPGLDEVRKVYPDIKLYLGELNEDVLLGAHTIVLSPGVSRQELAVAKAINNKVPVVGDIQLFLDHVKSPVVGVTGSNGKSTVVTLLGEIAQRADINVAVGGNIGVPVLDLLDEEFDLYILELSSFQLESVQKADLQVACVLNVSADHMDRYTSLQDYFKAKQRIYYGAKNVVYNLDDRLSVPPVVNGVARSGFSLFKVLEENETKYWYDRDDKALMKGADVLMPYSGMKIKGLHNVANVLAAFAIGDYLNIDKDIIVCAVCNFKGLAHRCEWITETKGIVFINDSKATNVGATQAAINGLASDYSEVTLIAGGDGKGADFSALGETINVSVKQLILIGRDSSDIEQHVSDKVNIFHAIDMQSAVELALRVTRSGGLVLLSPACASFDMYSGYEERGQSFVDAVLQVSA